MRSHSEMRVGQVQYKVGVTQYGNRRDGLRKSSCREENLVQDVLCLPRPDYPYSRVHPPKLPSLSHHFALKALQCCKIVIGQTRWFSERVVVEERHIPLYTSDVHPCPAERAISVVSRNQILLVGRNSYTS